MGEVVVSSEEGRELEGLQEGDSEKRKDVRGSAGMVRWERFLPRMALRVLLVEADDSTRQIVAALLRKCSYKVAAVPDGLKAWEVLKGRPHNIDLILTEVELPSISGFALLTLIMEHETCKSIPVIMMSWHDSITTVYKCMLRGAADFLVKPIRRNELKNLWQHVWRRQCSTVCKSSPQDESGAQQKVEATAENNATSNHSSGYKACVQMNKECIEKGSDAQSSCTKPDMEAEKTYIESMQDFSESKHPFQKSDGAVKSGQESFIQENEAGGSAVASVKEANKVFWNKDVEQERGRQDLNDPGQACDNNDVLLNSSKEAIDLIGAFDNNLKCGYRVSGSNIIQNKLDSFSQLDLSLRRSHPGGPENQITDEKQTLNHSNASAFSRYINRASHPLRPVPGNACDQRTEYGANSDKNLSSRVLGYNSDASVSTRNVQRNIISMVNGRFEQSEGVLSCPQEGVIPVSVPMGGVKFDSFCAGFGPVRPPLFRTQSGPSPVQNPSSASYHEGSTLLNKHQSRAETNRSKQLFEPFTQNANNLSDQMRPEEDHKLVSLDDQGLFSTSTDQGATSRFCNGSAIQLNSISMCGSNGPSNPVALVRTGSEGGNEDGSSAYDGNSYRYTQREAALNKFRLKRKDRCFEKKVRYESRKKLAEQRPRIKGQFVRQAYADAPPPEIEHS